MMGDGFRRAGWPNAAMVEEMRCWLDPQPGDTPLSNRDFSNARADAVGRLRDLAAIIEWTDTPAFVFSSDVAFALALDKCNGDVGDRLLTMVCRAYARAEQYAARYADLEAERLEVRSNLTDLDKVLTTFLGSPCELRRAITRVEAFRSEKQVDRTARADSLSASILEIRSFREELIGLYHFKYSTFHDPYVVFILRILNVISLSTNIKIVNHDTGHKKTQWRILLVAINNLIGTDLEEDNYDTLLRKVSGRGAYNGPLSGQENYLRSLLEPPIRERIHAGHLGVTGIEEDLKLPPAPSSWV